MIFWYFGPLQTQNENRANTTTNRILPIEVFIRRHTQTCVFQMQAVDNGVNVVVLDAWRNNPFARSFRSFKPGLAKVNAFEFG